MDLQSRVLDQVKPEVFVVVVVAEEEGRLRLVDFLPNRPQFLLRVTAARPPSDPTNHEAELLGPDSAELNSVTAQSEAASG